MFLTLGNFFYVGVLLFTPHLFFFPTIYLVLLIETTLFFFTRKIKKDFLIFLSIVLLMSLISSTFNNIFSFEFFRQVIIFFILYLGLNRIYDNLNDSTFFKLILCWLLLQCLVIILSGLLPTFANFFHDIFTLTDKAQRYIGDNVLVNRYSGFSPSGFSTLSVYLTLLLFLIINNDNFSGFTKVITSTLVFFAIVFVGRSGFVSLFLYTIFISLFSIRSFLIFIFSILIIFLNIQFLFDIDISQNKAVEFAIDPFINGFDSVTLKVLLDSEIYFPEFSLFGNGALIRSEGGEHSDLGWVKLVGFWGYIFTFTYGFLFIWFVCNNSERNHKSLVYIFLIIWTFFNFKDMYFLSSGYIQAFIILYIVTRKTTVLHK